MTWLAIAEPATEQTGQICDPDGLELTSTQKWNCAARKATARNRANARNSRAETRIY